MPDLQTHSPAMGQKDGEKWTAAVDLQPTIPKSDRLLGNQAATRDHTHARRGPAESINGARQLRLTFAPNPRPQTGQLPVGLLTAKACLDSCSGFGSAYWPACLLFATTTIDPPQQWVYTRRKGVDKS